MVGSDNHGSEGNTFELDRRTVLSAVGSTGAATLAGCLGGNGEGGGGEIATGQNAYEGETITGLLKEGYESDIIAEYNSDFEEMTGSTVQVERYTEAEAHQNFVLAANNQSEAYDFNTTQHWYYPQMQENEWLSSMDELLSEHQADWLDFSYDRLYDTVKEPFQTDGTPYAVPHSLLTGMLFYRQDVFEDLGIDEPETTADVMQAAEEIAASDYDMAPAVGRTAATFSSFGTWAGWAWGYGAKVLSDDGEVQVDTPEMRQAVGDLVTLMRDYGPAGAASIKWTDLPSYVLQGDAAMVFDTSGWGGTFHAERDDVTETLITGPADNHLQWMYAEGLGIPSWIGNGSRGAGWQVIQWRMSEEVMRHEVESQNRFDIPHKDVIGADWYTELAEERDMGHHVEVLQQSFEVLNDEYWPYVTDFGKLGNAFMQEMSSAIDGEQSADEAVQKAHQRIQNTLS